MVSNCLHKLESLKIPSLFAATKQTVIYQKAITRFVPSIFLRTDCWIGTQLRLRPRNTGNGSREIRTLSERLHLLVSLSLSLSLSRSFSLFGINGNLPQEPAHA